MAQEIPQVSLRRLGDADAADIARACTADPVIMRWVMRLSNGDVSAARQWIAERHHNEETGRQITRAITEAGDDRFLGAIWLGRFDTEAKRAELAFWTVLDERRRGLASAAVIAMTAFGFEKLDLLRVQILAATENLASQRVAEKAGLTREGVLRQYRRIDGEHTDLVMYSLLKPEWRQRR